MDKPRVLIQIALLDNGEIGVSSTSPNQVTNLGLLGIAQTFFQGAVKEAPKSNLIQPDLILPRNGR